MINLAKAHLQFSKLDGYGIYSDIVIFRLMWSVSLGPKVITLSGFHCTCKLYVYKICIQTKQWPLARHSHRLMWVPARMHSSPCKTVWPMSASLASPHKTFWQILANLASQRTNVIATLVNVTSTRVGKYSPKYTQTHHKVCHFFAQKTDCICINWPSLHSPNLPDLQNLPKCDKLKYLIFNILAKLDSR